MEMKRRIDFESRVRNEEERQRRSQMEGELKRVGQRLRKS